METDIHIKIERYLGSSMSPEELEAFEEELLSNNELRKEVNLYRSINLHLNPEIWEPIKASNESKKELEVYFKSSEAKELKQKIQNVQNKYNTPQQYSFIKYIAAAAVVLLVATVSYFSLRPQSYEDLYVTFYDEKELPSLVTRGSSKETLSDGVIAFKANRYKEALQLLNDYTSHSTNMNPAVYIYKGMCHLELNEFNKAIESFDELVNSDSIDRSKGMWYKCLVYLKTKDVPNLKLTLQQILKNPRNYNYEKSGELLESL